MQASKPEAKSQEQLESLVLQRLDKEGEIPSSQAFAEEHGCEHDLLVGALKSLEVYELVSLVLEASELKVLTPFGEEVLAKGSPEARLWHAVPAGGTLLKTEAMKLDFGKAGFPEAMKRRWISFDNASGNISRQAESIEDEVQQQVQAFREKGEGAFDKKTLLILTKRKIIAEKKTKAFRVSKGAKFSVQGKRKLAVDLTPEMIASGSWQTEEFKPYNFNSLGVVPVGGHLHPLLQVRTAFREIFLEMGFEEMPTNAYVESSFWNFDSLFQPQQHPARDAHDTFFLTNPATLLRYPEEYLQKVKEMHESGGNGSIGWRYDWKIEEAKKNLLRTHTTAVSSKMLYKLAQQPVFTPKKYFSIDKVYRNETLDATHLAEFHQIEGLVADYDLTLADLIGTISQFFHKWGMTELRFKPAYNPYTEPSMEIFGFHKQLKKWVEIGNSGIFRPEMLIPMGLDPDVKVIAWGLSLERPTMIRYGISNIRDLVGHKVSLDFQEKSSTCDIQLADAYDGAAFVKKRAGAIGGSAPGPSSSSSVAH
ncbi:phenylalanine--tRNA ligase [Balamuthia mandrillaris]